MSEIIDTQPAGGRDVANQVGTFHILYGLHLLAPFTMWVLAIVAVIIAHVKRPEVTGSWLESHHGWLTRTFWWGLLWAVIAWTIFWVLGVLTLGIGMLVLWIGPLIVFIWYLYRVIRGWLRLAENQPAP
jgi:uncharacterized membrane protein